MLQQNGCGVGKPKCIHVVTVWLTHWYLSKIRHPEDNNLKFAHHKNGYTNSISVGDDRDFWRECKIMQGGNGMKSHEIDGVSGSASIAELFANKYQLLYNTAKNQRQDLNDIQGTI